MRALLSVSSTLLATKILFKPSKGWGKNVGVKFDSLLTLSITSTSSVFKIPSFLTSVINFLLTSLDSFFSNYIPPSL